MNDLLLTLHPFLVLMPDSCTGTWTWVSWGGCWHLAALIGQTASSHPAVQMIIVQLLADSRHDLSRRQPLLRLRALAGSRELRNARGFKWFSVAINISVSSVHRLDAGEQ